MKIFNRKPEYYVEVIRVWDYHSFDTTVNCMTYSHPVFIVKKKNLFKKDTIIRTYYYTSKIESVLDYLRKLNGQDYINNEDACNKYGTFQYWCNNHDSGTYIKTK